MPISTTTTLNLDDHGSPPPPFIDLDHADRLRAVTALLVALRQMLTQCGEFKVSAERPAMESPARNGVRQFRPGRTTYVTIEVQDVA